MQFKVPQFIERKPKIVGPLTFRQFLYFALAGAVGFVLYFSASFSVFILVTIILFLLASGLAFLQVGKQTLPTVLVNFLTYFVSPRIYLWRKRALPPKFSQRVEKPKEEKGEGPSLKIGEKSQLNKLSTKIEIRMR